MRNQVYAMDTHFMCDNQGPSIQEQAAIVKKIGYDGFYATADRHKLDKLIEYRDASHKVGLELDFRTLLQSPIPSPRMN
jgi:hypothetical protein